MQTTSEATTWWQRAHGGDERELLVAYFSMEFGLHERLPIYSGGLGVLAGDHLKAAAELGVPLVGVGLLYRGGYFRQGVDAAGRQTEDYQPVDPEAVGVSREPVVGLGRARRGDDRSRRVAQGGRLRHALPAGGRLADRLALRRRPRAPDPAGAAARGRRRSRAGGARDRADRLPPERRPLRVPPDRARARARRAGAGDGRGARAGAGVVGLHDAHARCRPGTRCSTRSSSSGTSGRSPPTPASTGSGSSSSAASATSPASA